jgi:hypothetical protein
MAALATMDDLVAALASRRLYNYWKVQPALVAAWHPVSLWMSNGYPVAAGTPTAYGSNGDVLTRTSAGGMPYRAPTAGYDLHLLTLGGQCRDGEGLFVLYDRVWQCSGFSGTVTTAQTIPAFPALPARAGTGVGLRMFLEVYTAWGTTDRTVTVIYTNSAGVAGRSATFETGAVGDLNAVGQMYELQLQAGDVGVQSIQSLTLSGTTGTAGNVGITLLGTIASVAVTGGCFMFESDLWRTGLPQIPDDACLAAYAVTGGTGPLIPRLAVTTIEVPE